MENLDQIIACPLCESKDDRDAFLSSKDMLVSGQLFHMEQCRSCHLVYTNPRPNKQNIKHFYQSDDYISHSGTAHSLLDKAYLLVRKIMMNKKRKLVSSMVPKQSYILDIGCGTGSFLHTMHRAGYRVMGVEPDEQARKRAKGKAYQVFEDVNALKQYLPVSRNKPSNENISGNALHDGNDRFQCITLWHVLEHIHDFTGQLLEAYNLLNDRGILVVAVPMYKSLDAIFYKQHWAAYDLPRHLYHFDSSSLNEAAENAGFVFLKSRPLPFDSFYVSLLSENYMGTKPAVVAKIRALFIGLLSNITAATTTRPASSQVFIFRKK